MCGLMSNGFVLAAPSCLSRPPAGRSCTLIRCMECKSTFRLCRNFVRRCEGVSRVSARNPVCIFTAIKITPSYTLNYLLESADKDIQFSIIISHTNHRPHHFILAAFFYIEKNNVIPFRCVNNYQQFG